MQPPRLAGWAFADHHLISDGLGGTVWRVELADGRTAALKRASKAAAAEAMRAADYLRWRDGSGAVRLIDRQGGLVLLEWLGEHRLVDHLDAHGDVSATEIAAEAVLRLHAPRSSPPQSLRPLRDHFSSLFEKAEADRRSGAEGPFVEGASLAQDLLDSQRDIQPLHGDVHHENILLGQRGWLAVDPKALAGDPVFDVTNLFHNPLGSELRANEARAATMAALLAKALERDIETVLAWTLAYSCLSAAWHVEDGNAAEVEDSLSVHRAVTAVLAQIRS